MTEPKEALKPCPFCGGEAKTTEKRFGVPKKWRILWGVYCDGDCGTFFDCREPSESKAIAAWNTRADATENAALREKLAVARKALRRISYVAEDGESVFDAESLAIAALKELDND